MSIILITGASGGIAQGLVEQIPSTNQLILWGRSKERLDEHYGHLTHVESCQVDICDEKQVVKALEILTQKYGGLDILINNAGYGSFKTYEDYSQSEVVEMFSVNTIAVMTLSRFAAQIMEKQGKGHIITIASMAGHVASQKASVYSATKFAVIGFSNALRLELADKGIFVTTVNPGPVKTDFFKQADPSGQYLKKIDAYTLEASAVARKIIAIFGKNKRELNMPFSLELVHLSYKLFPKLSDYLARKVFNYK